jgi:hypothetical protein
VRESRLSGFLAPRFRAPFQKTSRRPPKIAKAKLDDGRPRSCDILDDRRLKGNAYTAPGSKGLQHSARSPSLRERGQLSRPVPVSGPDPNMVRPQAFGQDPSNILPSRSRLRPSPRTRDSSAMPRRPQPRSKGRARWCTGGPASFESTRPVALRSLRRNTTSATDRAWCGGIPGSGSAGGMGK